MEDDKADRDPHLKRLRRKGVRYQDMELRPTVTAMVSASTVPAREILTFGNGGEK